MCIVRGEEQKKYVEELVRTKYPRGKVHVIDSLATPSFRQKIKTLVGGGNVSQGGSDVVFDTVGTDALFCEELLRSVHFDSHILLVAWVCY